MKRVILCLIALVCASHQLGAALPSAVAAESQGVVIAQVAPNGATASQEYVSIYNNSDADIDVTGWCIKYNGSTSKPGCLSPTIPDTRLYLAARSYTTFSSQEFMTAHPGFVPQARVFSAGLADSGGTLTLVDHAGNTHDSFTWSKKLTAGSVYQRATQNTGVLTDTNQDATDFGLAELNIPSNQMLYDVEVVVDVCPNIIDIQETIPPGFAYDSAGGCVQDLCPNIDGLQATVPDNHFINEAAHCAVIPIVYPRILITELYPNPPSYDTGQEFIEVFNPGSETVSLQGYQFEVGPLYTKKATLPALTIEPGQYMVVMDTQTNLSLPNTAGSVRLAAPNGVIVTETTTYDSPPEGKSWSVHQDIWGWTSIPTPGAENQDLDQTAEPDSNLASGDLLTPCPTGKYRHPTTNRCRNISTETSGLKPCAADQYRSPETNRCRKLSALTSGGLTPCKPNQVRNSETNRCRAVASAHAAKPCQDGYERNPETNRCRKKTTPNATLPTDPNQTRTTNNVLTIALLGLTAGYAAYEYRYDVANMYRRLRVRQQFRRG